MCAELLCFVLLMLAAIRNTSEVQKIVDVAQPGTWLAAIDTLMNPHGVMRMASGQVILSTLFACLQGALGAPQSCTQYVQQCTHCLQDLLLELALCEMSRRVRLSQLVRVCVTVLTRRTLGRRGTAPFRAGPLLATAPASPGQSSYCIKI